MVNKVWLYVLRKCAEQVELLVFDHIDVQAGTQIPAGTVEPNEDIEIAAHRELFEEAGIRVETLTPLGTIERNGYGQDVRAHLFAAMALANAADEWVHQVSGKGEDEGMAFRFFWLPRAQWQNVWGDFKLGCPALESLISNSLNHQI